MVDERPLKVIDSILHLINSSHTALEAIMNGAKMTVVSKNAGHGNLEWKNITKADSRCIGTGQSFCGREKTILIYNAFCLARLQQCIMRTIILKKKK